MGRPSARSLAMKEAWARRKAQKEAQGNVEETNTETRTVRKSSLELSRNFFTLEQVKELGLYGVTNDGEKYRLVMEQGRPIQ